MAIWTELLTLLGAVLRFFHDNTVGLFGEYSWVAAIILLTVTVRLLLTPLAVKQFRSMQAMQNIRPQMKKIQDRYKTDRGMMRTDPEKYRAQRQKQQEELMALYKENNVNPAASCLPLIAQMPIFIALYSVLRSETVIPELVDAPFFGGSTLQAAANTAGIIAIGLLIAMGITTFVQQKQMMGRNAAMANDQQMQQQKMMLYIMPVFLVVLGYNLPIGVLVYWVTTNLWQMGQQWFIMREVAQTTPPPKKGKGNSPAPTPDKKAPGAGTKKPGGKANSGKGEKASDADGEAKPAGDDKAASADGKAGDGKTRSTKDGGSTSRKKPGSDAAKRNGTSPNGSRNGQRSSKPKNTNKQPGETGDTRR